MALFVWLVGCLVGCLPTFTISVYFLPAMLLQNRSGRASDLHIVRRCHLNGVGTV